MWMWIAGLILLAVSVGLAFGYSRAKRRSAIFAATDTSTVELLESMAEEMEGVPLSHITEVKGTAVCEAPLTSELAEVECVYYDMSVVREYEETYYDTDSEGNRTRKTRKGTDKVSSNRQSVPFYVRDTTGQIRVQPGGAELIAEKVLSRFEPEGTARNQLKIGQFSFNVDISAGFGGGGRRTLGYRFEETAIPVGREVYVLGEVAGQPGNLQVKLPSGKQRFIISTKSEEQLQKEADSSSKAFLIGAIACGAIGIVLAIVGVI